MPGHVARRSRSNERWFLGRSALFFLIMPAGLDKLKHIVVLMMENRSFDHMLGALKATDARIDGLDGTQSNPDTSGKPALAQPLAEFQGQLDPDPDHHFPGVDLQIFNGETTPDRVATMQGFVKSYFSQRKDVKHSRKIMYYFTPDKLPVLTTLAHRIRGLQPLVRVDPRPDAVQSRVRALRHVLRSRRHGAALCERQVQEHLPAARVGRQDRQDLLLRHQELLARSDQPAAAPAAVLRHVPAVPRRLRQGHVARLLPSSSRTTATTTATAAPSSRRTSTRTITCRKANGSSRPSTTRSARMPLSGNRPRC